MKRKYKLVAFDVDGTLIDEMQFIWTALHRKFAVDEEALDSAREMFEKRQITFREWAEHDIRQWIAHGATRNEILKSIKSFRIMEGAMQTLQELKRRGYTLAVISGGLDTALYAHIPDADSIFRYIIINRLVFDASGNLTGIHVPREYDSWGESKQRVLRSVAKKEGITTEQCVFVGDSNNDLDVIREAGLGIAFNATPELSEVADAVIRKKDLRMLLDILE